jgi:NAD(P)-dependent dehydrogenase (short-subunit alcohol dehydrogenase family)
MSRTVLITGATGKFGSVLVQHFLNAGDHVIAIGRSKEALNKLGAISLYPGRLHLLKIDLMEDDLGGLLIEKLSSLGKEPDCLINSARSHVSLRLDAYGKARPESFLDEFKLGVVVPYELVMALANQAGSCLRAVVNVGSIYGAVAPNLKLYADHERQSPIQYGVTKAALAHLTKELAVRLAAKHIRVNCVAYGGVEGRVDEAFEQRYAALCPSGRMLRENEIVGPIDMVLSESASGITGHVLMVDGGWSVW